MRLKLKFGANMKPTRVCIKDTLQGAGCFFICSMREHSENTQRTKMLLCIVCFRPAEQRRTYRQAQPDKVRF